MNSPPSPQAKDPKDSLAGLTEHEKTIVLATELMGWKLRKDKYSFWYVDENGKDIDYTFLPYQDENHARQVIEKVMEDEELFLNFVARAIKEHHPKITELNQGIGCIYHFMKATLSERMDAVISVLPKK